MVLLFRSHNLFTIHLRQPTILVRFNHPFFCVRLCCYFDRHTLLLVLVFPSAISMVHFICCVDFIINISSFAFFQTLNAHHQRCRYPPHSSSHVIVILTTQILCHIHSSPLASHPFLFLFFGRIRIYV